MYVVGKIGGFPKRTGAAGSDTSTILTADMERIIEKLVQNKNRQSMKNNYLGIWRQLINLL